MEYINFLEQAKLLEKCDRKQAESKYTEFIQYAEIKKSGVDIDKSLLVFKKNIMTYMYYVI